MALFPNQHLGSSYDGIGKTHTNLVVSDGDASSEVFVVSRENDSEKFIYEYGPEGNQVVDIAKGKIVEANGVEHDRTDGYDHTAIRVAPEDSERVIGINHQNVYETRRDAMEGSRATVITRNVVEVPLFEASSEDTAKQAAAAMKFGAAYGVSGDFEPGKYVVAGANGNFKLLDNEKHDFRHVVGQIQGVTRDLPPQGFLQYFMDIDNKDYEDFIKGISAAPTPGGKGYPYGAPYSNKGWKKDFEKLLGAEGAKGIPFLTDGFFRAEERIDVTSKADDEHVEAVVANEVVELNEDGSFKVNDSKEAEGAIFIKLKHKLNPRRLNELKATLTTNDDETVSLSNRDIHLDVENNTVVLYVPAGEYSGAVTTVEAIVNPVAGIPTEWDYKGSTGAVRILLQK